MEELEKQINGIMNQLNQSWIGALKEAEKNNKGIDLSEVMQRYSDLIQKKDSAFQDARIRVKTKKGFFK